MANDPNREGSGATPPYIAFQSLKTLCGTLKDHGLPARIDRSMLGNFSGAVGGQLITALKFLRLTDDAGHPTQGLADLVGTHGTDEWPRALKSVVVTAFRPIFDLNLETASPAQFNEKFRSTYNSKDETLRKCQGFFLNAVREAGIPVSAYIMKNKKPRSGPIKRRAKPSNGKAETAASASSDSEKIKDIHGNDAPEKPTPVHSNIAAQLLDKFPAFDPEWPDTIKAKWFEGYERLLAMGEKKP